MTTWRGVSSDDYDARWKAMAAAGKDPHGEVAFVQRYEPDRVLDAGCGTGRVAIELTRRGVSTVGVDVNEEMLAAARAKAPAIEWHLQDLAELDLRAEFDVVVMAGNVMIFVNPGTEAAVVARVAAHLRPGGRLIAGFQLGRGYDLDDYDAHCAAAGLALAERYATWDGDPFPGDGSYSVSVHRRPGPKGLSSG